MEYAEIQLTAAWLGLRQTQRQVHKRRESYMEKLMDHFAEKRETTRVIEVTNICTSERTCNTAAKHKWYLKECLGMIRTLLIPDYKIHDILAIIRFWALTLLIQHFTATEEVYTPSLVIVIGTWGIFTVWEQLTAHEGWKGLSDKSMITERLLLKNGTHLSMSRDSPFACGPITAVIGLDREGTCVEEILQGTFDTYMEGLDGIAASSEIKSFIQAKNIDLQAHWGTCSHGYDSGRFM